MDQPQPRRDTHARVILRRYSALIGLIGLGIVILLILLTTFVFSNTVQTSIVSNVIVICLALFPLLVCGFALYTLLLAAIFGTNMLTRFSENNLGKVRTQTRRLAEYTGKTGNDLSRRSIGIGTRLSSLNVVFDSDKETKSSTESDATHE